MIKDEIALAKKELNKTIKFIKAMAKELESTDKRAQALALVGLCVTRYFNNTLFNDIKSHFEEYKAQKDKTHH